MFRGNTASNSLDYMDNTPKIEETKDVFFLDGIYLGKRHVC